MDVSKIEGYAEMTAEEKIAALEAYEVPDYSEENVKLKNALNKASSDVAEYKKQLRAKMDEQEKAEADRKEYIEKLERENAEAKKANSISTFKAQFMALGYSEELASSAAEAKVNGDTAKEFECQKTFNELKNAEFKASLIQNQPGLSKGGNPDVTGITKEQILAEPNKIKRMELIAEHRELFTGG